MAETKFVISVVDRATGPIKGIRTSFESLTGGFNKVRESILGVQSAASIFVTGWLINGLQNFASQFTRTAASFEAMQMRFKSLGAKDYSQDVMAFVEKNPLVGLENAQQAFVKLYATGINPTSRALQSLTDAVAAFGGTSQDFDKAMVAIVQISGKCVVNMEELRQQLGERIPTAVTTMAREMGYGEERLGEFFKLVEQGGVSGREGLAALFRGWEKDYGGSSERMKDTWNGLMASMALEWEKFKKDFMDEETFAKVKEMMKDAFSTFRDNKDVINDSLRVTLSLIEAIGREVQKVIRIFNVWYLAGKKTGAGVAGGVASMWSGYQNWMNKNILSPLGWGWDPKMQTTAQQFADDMLKKYDELHDRMMGVATKGAVGGVKSAAGAAGAAGPAADYFMRQPTGPYLGGPSSYATLINAAYDIPWKDVGAYIQEMRDKIQARMDFLNAPQQGRGFEGTFSQGFNAELARMEEDFNETFDSMAKKGAESAKIVANAMAGAFNDFFVDAIEGRLQQFKDYLLGFFTSIGRAISQILSQYLALQALGYMMPGAFGAGAAPGMGAGGVAPGAPAGAARLKGNAGASTPNVQIINNSGVPMNATASYSANDMGDMVMTVVMDAVGRNKGGSRDALRGMLAT